MSGMASSTASAWCPKAGAEKGEALAILPVGWVEGLPGHRLVGIHTRIMSKDEPTPDVAELVAMFGHEDLAGSKTQFRAGDGLDRLPHRGRWLHPHAGAGPWLVAAPPWPGHPPHPRDRDLPHDGAAGAAAGAQGAGRTGGAGARRLQGDGGHAVRPGKPRGCRAAHAPQPHRARRRGDFEPHQLPLLRPPAPMPPWSTSASPSWARRR